MLTGVIVCRTGAQVPTRGVGPCVRRRRGPERLARRRWRAGLVVPWADRSAPAGGARTSAGEDDEVGDGGGSASRQAQAGAAVRGSGCPYILVDEPTQDVDAVNLIWPHGFTRRRGEGCRQRYGEVEAAMRPGGVVMRQVGGQRAAQVPAAADQQ